MGPHTRTNIPDSCCSGISSRDATPAWKYLFNFTVRRHFPALSFALIFTIISGIVVPILAVLFGKIFGAFTDFGGGKITGHALTNDINTYAIGVVLLGGATWFSNGLYCMGWMTFGALQATEVRNRLFQNLLHKDIEWYETNTSGIGALLPRLQTQIRDLQMATSQPIGFVAQNLVSTLASLGLALYYSWKLTLVTLSTVPVAFLVLASLSAAIQPQIIRQDIELTRAGKHAHTAISAIETVKSFNAQEHEVTQYAGAIKRAASCYLKQARSNAVQMGFVRVFTLSMFVQGFWYGNHLAATQALSFSDMTTAFWACLLAVKAFEDILPQLLVLEKGRTAATALKWILDEVTKERNLIGGMCGEKAPKFCDGDIEMRAVTFAYPSRPDHLVLKPSTLFFPAGETTFLVGRSGSGKSTIADLLMRFHDASTGDIYIDRHNITELDIAWLRNNITLVQQKTILFNETIWRNISFGKHQHLMLSESELKKCIEVAMLEPLLAHLPRGADTQVGATGAALSGGQRQRIAIARARLRDTPILILDEATGALDYIGQMTVMNAIRDWRKGKTTIIITHDMTQIRNDDFVYVLEDGIVVREGFKDHLALDDTGAFALMLNAATQENHNKAMMSDSTLQEGSQIVRALHSRPVFIRNVPPNRRSVLDTRSLTHQTDIDPTNPTGQPFTRFNPIAPTTVHRRSSSSPIIEEERPHTLKVPQAISRLSLYLQPLDMEAQPARPLSMHGPPRTRMPRPKTAHHPPLSSSDYSLPEPIHATQKRRHQRDEENNPSAKTKRLSATTLLLTVWPNLPARHRTLLLTGVLAALTNAAGPPVFSYIFSRLLTTFFDAEQETHKALIYSVAILGVAAVDGLCCYAMHYALESCGQTWVDKLRISALRRILDQPREWFDAATETEDSNSTGALAASLDRNALELRNLLGRFAGPLFIAAAMLLLATAWSLAVCWQLTLVCVAAVPGLYGVTKTFDRVTARWERTAEQAASAAGSVLVETFADIRTVRALTLEGYFHRKYNEATARGLAIGVRRAVNCGIWFGAAESAIQFFTALTFWYGARVVAAGDSSINSVLTVFSMILFSATNANAVLLFVPQISSSLETGTRLLKLSRLPLGKSHEYDGQIRPSRGVEEMSVQFNDLTFAYPTRVDVPALKGLTLSIPAGKCTVIAGQSGSGKSTVASLILRFYACDGHAASQQGDSRFPALTISSYSIARLSTTALRDIVSIVPQTPIIFPTSVAQNITYGLSFNSRHTTTESIESAAKAAGIHDFILTLPQGYNTVLGDSVDGSGGGGVGLSGGQAQRIVIARALVREPRILILDEATSALDKDSARQVRDTVRKLVDNGTTSSTSSTKKMTVIVITHAEEMMSLGDKVVVLRQGRCVEEGTFEQLKRKRDGELARMLAVEG